MTQAISTVAGERVELGAPGMTKMQEMARRMWLPVFLMGAMVLIASLVIGAVQSGLASDLFEVGKTTREVNPSGSLLDKQQFIESTSIWLPRFQLLGMGMMFGGITFLLATILGNLRLYGGLVQEKSGRRVLALKPPLSAQLFPMLMMLGEMVLIGAFVVSIVIATITSDVFGNPISVIDGAGSGSGLLGDFQTVKTYGAWLQGFALAGLGLVLSGIVLALYTIAQVLRFQHSRIAELAEGAE
jgi:hypothetical protein